MLKGLFKQTKYIKIKPKAPVGAPRDQSLLENQPSIPPGTWVKCPDCGEIIYHQDLKRHQENCKCRQGNERLSAPERLHMLLDKGSFQELDVNVKSGNPLNYPGYGKKLEQIQGDTGLREGVITGLGTIHGIPLGIAVMDSRFFMGSMGSALGEKLCRLVETATAKALPLVIFTASGGARMQEGIFSLMQMAKVSAALAKHHEAGLLYITVLTDPTTGGVTASFAMLGDIILAEPGALIGFAGPRVIEQTIRQKLPEGFQRAEFLLEHGFIDAIVPRNQLKETLGRLLAFHRKGEGHASTL